MYITFIRHNNFVILSFIIGKHLYRAMELMCYKCNITDENVGK